MHAPVTLFHPLDRECGPAHNRAQDPEHEPPLQVPGNAHLKVQPERLGAPYSIRVLTGNLEEVLAAFQIRFVQFRATRFHPSGIPRAGQDRAAKEAIADPVSHVVLKGKDSDGKIHRVARLERLVWREWLVR